MCIRDRLYAERNRLKKEAKQIETIKSNVDTFLAPSAEDVYKRQTPTEFTCIEPDFIFELTPKEDLRSNPRFVYIRPGCEIADIDLEWKVFHPVAEIRIVPDGLAAEPRDVVPVRYLHSKLWHVRVRFLLVRLRFADDYRRVRG